jgi:hypothetical protein
MAGRGESEVDHLILAACRASLEASLQRAQRNLQFFGTRFPAHPVDAEKYVTPVLTEDKVTAREALAMSSVGSASGNCTRERPWGGQCTALLRDGTPVDRDAFKRDVLLVLAGDKSAGQVVAEWQGVVDGVYERAAAREAPTRHPNG